MSKISDLPFGLQIVIRTAGFDASQSINDFHEYQGMTPLMVLCASGNAIGVRTLLELGADPTLQIPASKHQTEGMTALSFAAMNGNIDCVQTILSVLLTAGVSVDIANQYGYSPLMIATYKGNFRAVELLLKNKADPNLQNKKGQTALHFAVGYAQPESAFLLLKAGANPNTCSAQGLTPLMARYDGDNSEKYLKCVELLLEKGAKITGPKREDLPQSLKQDNTFKEKSVLHRILNTKNEDVIKLLLVRGADANEPDDAGDTPLVKATEMALEKTMVNLIRHNAKLLPVFDKPDLPRASILFYADDRALPIMVGTILNECLYMATLKYNHYKKNPQQVPGKTPEARLKELIEGHLTHSDPEYARLNQTVQNCVHEPVLQQYLPKQTFLTAYALTRVAKHVIPKSTFPASLISHILSFTTDILGEKRRARFERNIILRAVNSASLTSGHVSEANKQLLRYNKGLISSISNETLACTTPNLNYGTLWMLSESLNARATHSNAANAANSVSSVSNGGGLNNSASGAINNTNNDHSTESSEPPLKKRKKKK